jgi:hypothetical protein
VVFHGGDIFGGVRNQGGDLCSQRDTTATSAGAATSSAVSSLAVVSSAVVPVEIFGGAVSGF